MSTRSSDRMKIAVLFGVLAALLVGLIVTESNVVGTVAGLYAIGAGIALGAILARGESRSAGR